MRSIMEAGPNGPVSIRAGLLPRLRHFSSRIWTSCASADAAAVALLALVAVAAALTFRDYGLGWDDYTHAQYGALLLDFYRSGFTDRRAFSFVNLYMYGGGFDMAAALAAKVLPFGLFETRRLAGAVVGLIGLAVTWRIGRRIGGPVAGLAAIILLAICPLYYGHMYMNPKDAPFAAAMAVLLLGLARAFHEYPRPSPATVALFGAGLGLAIGSRILGVLAVFDVAAAAVLILVLEAREDGLLPAARRLGAFALRLLPGLVLGYIIMGLIWPWSVLAPLNPLRAAEYFSHFFEKPWHELFGGMLYEPVEMPRSYVPTLFALKMPLLFLALAIGGIALGFAEAFLPRARPGRRAALLLLAVAAVLPIAITVIGRPAMYNGIRHFVFVTPPLAALGGLAAARIAHALPRFGRLATAGAAALAAIGIAMPAVAFARLHPYEYTYFNAIAGGVAGARPLYMLDYWGLSFKQAARGLRRALAARGEKPPAGGWTIVVCGPHPPAEVELGPEFKATWDPHGADFALMLGEFYCARPNAPVLAEVKRAGVIYARAYDLRGRTLDRLLTLPPVQ